MGEGVSALGQARGHSASFVQLPPTGEGLEVQQLGSAQDGDRSRPPSRRVVEGRQGPIPGSIAGAFRWWRAAYNWVEKEKLAAGPNSPHRDAWAPQAYVTSCPSDAP